MLNPYLKRAIIITLLGSMSLSVQAAGKTKAPDTSLKIQVKQINVPAGTEASLGVSKSFKGKLSKGNEVHIYVVCATIPGSFSAILSKYPGNTRLSLFGQGGLGIMSSFNNSLATNATGLMYLAISNRGNAPTSQQGEIFEESGQPTGSGGSWPVVDWTKQGDGKGAYEIAITGLSPLNRCPSMEPSTDEE